MNLYKIFDIDLDGSVSLIEFITGSRNKMTGLDKHNMNQIEASMKKVFRNLSTNKSNAYDQSLEPGPFSLVCISLLWIMKTYSVFKKADPIKTSKITLSDLKESEL